MERNGRGWKVAMILGTLLSASVGALGGGAAVYLNHVSWALDKAQEFEVVKNEQASQSRKMTSIDVTLELFRKEISALRRAIDRLADAQCYRDTGKPCPRSMLDEKP